MRETRETALLRVACGKPARRRYCMHGCKIQSAPTTTVSCISSHAYSYIQQRGRSVETMKESPIHENADANITCDFGDGDISRFRSRLPHTRPDGHIVSSIIVRYSANPAIEPSRSGPSSRRVTIHTCDDLRLVRIRHAFTRGREST